MNLARISGNIEGACGIKNGILRSTIEVSINQHRAM